MLDEAGRQLDGVYACGWLSRGPSGIIGEFSHNFSSSAENDATLNGTCENVLGARTAGTNLQNALQVAEIIGEDTAKLKLVDSAVSPTAEVRRLLAERGVRPTSFADWERIDARERCEGEKQKKVREKIATMPGLLHVAGAA